MANNFDRLVQLAEDVFAVKNDPEQLDVNPRVIERLQRLHPSTLSQYESEDGPVAWILLMPSTTDLMHRFLEKRITEKELFELTPLQSTYDAIYLCSALVLPEFRRKGIAKQLILDAIDNIRKDHPITALFVWPFSSEGDLVSESIAHITGLPLLKRQHHL